MSVELPFAPVDTIIRRNAGRLRVSADAAEELARRIQDHGASLAADAAERATADGRKTLMAEDFGTAEADLPGRDDLGEEVDEHVRDRDAAGQNRTGQNRHSQKSLSA